MNTPAPAQDLIYPDTDLDATERAFAHRIRAFAQANLEPHARRIDEERTFRTEMVTELGAAGILGGPLQPPVGEGWSPMQVALANEELGAVCGNARGFCAVQSGLVMQTIERHASDEQKNRWLPELAAGRAIGSFGLTEPDAGSDVASLRTQAAPTADGYRLEGRKTWITNGNIADVVLVFANADPSRGKDGITAFLVDTARAGLAREPMPGVDLGHRGSDHAQLVFNGLHASQDDVVGGVGDGFEIAMAGLHAGRLSVAAGAVGIHRAALAATIDFVRARKQFGKALASFQMVQERIADMTCELLAARSLVWRCARRRQAGTDGPGDLASAKLYATEAAARACDQAVLLHGGRGYSSAFPVERLLRDSMGLRIYEGTSMVQKAILSRAVLRP